MPLPALFIPIVLASLSLAQTWTIPSTAPSAAATVNAAQLSVSIEFFAFPGYMDLTATDNCLANLQTVRGTAPAVRIGGTTQDRATYNSSLTTAVNYTVASSADAPSSLTYGPEFFTLASELKGDVTIGFNRQLNNPANSREAAVQAQKTIKNLLAVEMGNEPEYYASGSPIIPSNGSWTPTIDGYSQKAWFTNISTSIGNIFQGAVYLEYPTWSTQGLIPLLGSAITYVKTFSGHSYPQSACGGASTNLPDLMSHTGIVSYTSQYASEASAAHKVDKYYFLGETNSATCGGGGISPTFGAALWIIDYVLQATLNAIDRLYFHQGTIGNCAYCFWGSDAIYAPWYGAYFVSEFLGTDGVKLSELDAGTTAIAAYATYSSSGAPLRVLVYNSNYYDGSGTRSNTTVSFEWSSSGSASSVQAKRLTAPAATSLAADVTIGGTGTFDENCNAVNSLGTYEVISVKSGAFNVTVSESEAIIVYL